MKIKIEEDFPANRALEEKYDCCTNWTSYENLEQVRKLPMVTSFQYAQEEDKKMNKMLLKFSGKKFIEAELSCCRQYSHFKMVKKLYFL